MTPSPLQIFEIFLANHIFIILIQLFHTEMKHYTPHDVRSKTSPLILFAPLHNHIGDETYHTQKEKQCGKNPYFCMQSVCYAPH